MDIEEFYDGDQRRRDGEDRQYGLDWSDAADEHHLWDLYWNSGTGELYLMRKPVVKPAASVDPIIGWAGPALGDELREVGRIEHRIVAAAENLIHPRHIQAKTGQASDDPPKDALTEDLQVEVLGVVPDAAAVDEALSGWQEAMGEPNSLPWLRNRLKEKAVTA